MVCAYTITNLLSSSYALYKTNILLLYCITLFVLKSFMTFFVLHDYVICDCNRCYIFIMFCNM